MSLLSVIKMFVSLINDIATLLNGIVSLLKVDILFGFTRDINRALSRDTNRKSCLTRRCQRENNRLKTRTQMKVIIIKYWQVQVSASFFISIGTIIIKQNLGLCIRFSFNT